MPSAEPSLPARWRAVIAAQIPSREALERIRWLRPLAPRLAARDLWRLRPESVARGAALGMFWAFVLPVAQILVVALHCVWWRGHIPVAAAVTLITNPLTIGPWLAVAYQIGAVFVEPSAAVVAGEGWWASLHAFGAPTLLGMGILATAGALLAYLGVHLFARARLAWRMRRRALRGARP